MKANWEAEINLLSTGLSLCARIFANNLYGTEQTLIGLKSEKDEVVAPLGMRVISV